MFKEAKTLCHDKQVWNTIKRDQVPSGNKFLRGRWAFVIKTDAHGKHVKCKSRFVVQGYAQVHFGKTYAPTMEKASTRVLSAVSARLGLQIYSLDVCGAYLNAPLDEPEYMEIPREFAMILGLQLLLDPDLVFMIIMALYGMVQSALAWNKEYNRGIAAFKHGKNEFKSTITDPCVHVMRMMKEGIIFILGTHVDDCKLVCNDEKLVQEFVNTLPWSVQDLGLIDCFLSVAYDVKIDKGTVEMNQQGAVRAFLDKFDPEQVAKSKGVPLSQSGLKKFKGVASEKEKTKCLSMLGSIIYFATSTCPELSYAASKLASFASNPGPEHFKELERTAAYFRVDLEKHCIRFSKSACYTGDPANDPAMHPDGRIKEDCNLSHFNPELYVDANFVDDARDPDIEVKQKDMRSRGGVLLKMVGGPCHWQSKKHTLSLTDLKRKKTAFSPNNGVLSIQNDEEDEKGYISLHTMESEYITMAKGGQIGDKLINLMSEFGFKNVDFAMPIFEDNSACAKLATNQINRSNGKHIHLCFHSIKLRIEQGAYEVWQITDADQVADILTKSLHLKKFKYLTDLMCGLDIQNMKLKCKFVG